MKKWPALLPTISAGSFAATVVVIAAFGAATLTVSAQTVPATMPDSPQNVVTVDNFVRAETDRTMARYVAQGAFGKFFHIREPAPIDRQDVIRMNRDTLYSAGVFDLTSPLTIVKPNSAGRFQSMEIINQDHSILPVEHGSGKFVLTREKVGTRYVIILLRTFMDPRNPADIKIANNLQDRMETAQADIGSFKVPDWDGKSLSKVRDAINVLAATKPNASGMFGDKSKLNPIDHLLGTAYGWGGNPREAAIYVNRVPESNDGVTPHVLRVKDVPVDGFWSVTVYNAKGFMEKNDLGAYSINNVTAVKDPDGGVTIHFGGDPSKSNHLPITSGWNYIIRLYQPRAELLDGIWSFPVDKKVE